MIYISIGTILGGADEFFHACIDAFRHEGVTVVLSAGQGFDTSRLGRIPEDFIILNHIPQISVLKQADLFITHGGMNSVSEAMTYGVPMLVIPFVSDQPINARQVARLGLEQVLDRKSVSPAALKKMAFSIMADKSISQNVQNMAQIVAAAPGNTGAVRIIEQYYA